MPVKPKTRADSQSQLLSVTNEDFLELRNSVDFLSQTVNERTKSKEEISKILHLVTRLQDEIKAKNDQIRQLENRVEELEQYTRKEDIIISGLKPDYKSWARRAENHHEESRGNDNAPEVELESLEKQVLAFLNGKLDLNISSDDISACHTLRSAVASRTSKENIIVRFVNRKSKVQVMKKAKMLKGSNVFINEHLTKKNSELAWKARTLRKQHRIASTWIRDCKVFIRTVGSPEVARTHVIKSNDDFQKLHLDI